MNRKLPFNMKKVISVIVTLAFVISMFSCMSGVSVFADDTAPAVAAHTSHDEFTEFTGTEIPTASGKYYLTDDVTITSTAATTIPAGEDVTICLNGHKITNTKGGASGRIVVNGTFTICDCTNTGSYVRSQNSTTGGVAIQPANGGVFNLCSGTLDFSGNTTTGTGTGPITIFSNGTVNIYGGKIIGGSSPKGSITPNSGTAVLNIYGGEISGGSSASYGNDITLQAGSTLNMTGGRVGAGESGRDIYFVTTTTSDAVNKFNVGGTAVVANAFLPDHLKTAGALGATVSVIAGTPLAEGASIGISMQTPGVFAAGAASYVAYFKSADANCVLKAEGEDLVLEERPAHTHCVCGGNTDVGDHTTHTDIEFQPLTQDIVTTDYAGKLPLKGNWYLDENIVVSAQQNISAQTEALQICLNGHRIDYNSSGANNRIILMGNTSGKVNTLSITDCTGTGAFARTDATSTSNGGIILMNTTGNSTLNLYGGSIDASGVVTSGSGTSTNAGRGQAIVLGGSKATLNVYGGKIIGGTTNYEYTGTATNTSSFGGAIYNAGNVNLYGGEISGGTAINGGAVYSSYKLNISGGEIVGGTVTGGNGAAVYISGSGFKMEGGTIRGGIAQPADGSTTYGMGGAVYVTGGTADTHATMTGGTITGGTAVYGGALQVGYGSTSYFELAGGVIDGGNATYGGAVGVWQNGNFILTDGTVKNGTVTENGGAVYVNGADGKPANFKMTGGTIESCSAKRGGAVSVRPFSSFDMSGGTIQNCTASLNGGAVMLDFVTSNNDAAVATFNMTGGAISNCSAASNGGNIYLAARSVFNMSGSARISGGTANLGGNIFATGSYVNAGKGFTGATVNMTGGTVEKGSANYGGKNGGAADNGTSQSGGGNIYAGIGADVVIENGTVSGGTAYGIGGSIYAAGGTITYTDKNGNGEQVTEGAVLTLGREDKTGNVTVSGGKCYKFYNSSGNQEGGHGGNIYAGSTLNIYEGVVIEGGIAHGVGGGNISMTAATSCVNMYGGVIKNGQAEMARRANVLFFNKDEIQFNMTGGTITNDAITPEEGFAIGGIEAAKGTLNVSGSASVTGENGAVITKGGDGVIAINALTGKVVLAHVTYGQTAAVDAEYGDELVAAAEGFVKSYKDGYLILNTQAAIDEAAGIEAIDTVNVKNHQLFTQMSSEVASLITSDITDKLAEANEYKKMITVKAYDVGAYNDKQMIVFASSVDALAPYDHVSISITMNGVEKVTDLVNVYKNIYKDDSIVVSVTDDWSTKTEWVYAVALTVSEASRGRVAEVKAILTLDDGTQVIGDTLVVQIDDYLPSLVG